METPTSKSTDSWDGVLRRPGEPLDCEDPSRGECPAKDSCISQPQPNSQALCLQPAQPHPLRGPHPSSAKQGGLPSPHTPGSEPFQASHTHQADSRENVAPWLGPCCRFPPPPQRGFPCTCERPSSSHGGRQCTLCHKPVSEAKLLRRGSKLWDDSLPGWAAAAS